MDFRILGPLEVTASGRALELGAAKQRALLGVLLLQPNQAVSATRFIDELWGESPIASAAKVGPGLRQRPAQGARGRRDRHDRGRLPRPRWIRGTSTRRASRRWPPRGRPACRTIPRGPASACARRWRCGAGGRSRASCSSRSPRARPSAWRSSAWPSSSSASRPTWRWAATRARRGAPGARHAHPYRERMRAHLMLALYRCGRQAEALAAYRDTRALLAEELGLEPSAELQRLERQMLMQAPELDAPERPAAAAPAPPAAPASRARARAGWSAWWPRRSRSRRRWPSGSTRSRCTACSTAARRSGPPRSSGMAGRSSGTWATGSSAIFGLAECARGRPAPCRAGGGRDEGRRRRRSAPSWSAITGRASSCGSASTRVRSSSPPMRVAGPRRRETRSSSPSSSRRPERAARSCSGRAPSPCSRRPSARSPSARSPWRGGRPPSAPGASRASVSDEPVLVRAHAPPFVGRGRELGELRRGPGGGGRELDLPSGHGRGRGGPRQVAPRARVRGRDRRRGDRRRGPLPPLWRWARLPPAGGDGPAARGGDRSPGIAELVQGDDRAGSIARLVSGAIGASDEPATVEETSWAIRRLFEGIARERPLVAVVEDVHWAQPTLLDLLEYVVAFSSDAPILLLCLARPELLDDRPLVVGAAAQEIAGGARGAFRRGGPCARRGPGAAGGPAAHRPGSSRGPTATRSSSSSSSRPGSRARRRPFRRACTRSSRRASTGSSPGERMLLGRAAVEGRAFHVGALRELLPDDERPSFRRTS